MKRPPRHQYFKIEATVRLSIPDKRYTASEIRNGLNIQLDDDIGVCIATTEITDVAETNYNGKVIK